MGAADRRRPPQMVAAMSFANIDLRTLLASGRGLLLPGSVQEVSQFGKLELRTSIPTVVCRLQGSEQWVARSAAENNAAVALTPADADHALAAIRQAVVEVHAVGARCVVFVVAVSFLRMGEGRSDMGGGGGTI